MMAFAAMGQSPCPEDSVALNVALTTDAWGYELYWELIPFGAECGDGNALLWGGNSEVGCGNDVAGLPGDPYASNSFFNSPTVCVSEEDSLVLVHRDSYGDGGTQFTIALGGEEVMAFAGSGSGNDWTFRPALLNSDQPCLAQSIVADGPSWVGSTTDATVSPGEPAPPEWGCGTYGGWCESGLNRTVWLSWEVPQEGGVYYITTCNDSTTFDTQLALWDVEDCLDFSTYELINANDDIGCASGSFRSGFLTPCLEGGQTLLLQVDGYYGEVGTVEVSIVSASPEDWSVSVSPQDLSCSLETGFNPNGAIYTNTNVGPAAVDWAWTGPFGFTSTEAFLAPLLPGEYHLEAEFCGQSFEGVYEVEEPAPIEVEVTLSPDCEAGTMTGAAVVLGGQGVAEATWTVGSFEAAGAEVFNLPGGLCQVEVVDENGCEASEWVWVETVGVPDVDLGPDLFGCAGDAFTLLAPLGNNLSYTWTTGHSGPMAVVQTETPGTLVVAVEVSDEAGCSFTDAVILTLDDCSTEVGNLNAGWGGLSVYPNPFTNTLVVRIESAEVRNSLRLFDGAGREIQCAWNVQGETATVELDVPAGVYVLKSDALPGGVRLICQ